MSTQGAANRSTQRSTKTPDPWLTVLSDGGVEEVTRSLRHLAESPLELRAEYAAAIVRQLSSPSLEVQTLAVQVCEMLACTSHARTSLVVKPILQALVAVRPGPVRTVRDAALERLEAGEPSLASMIRDVRKEFAQKRQDTRRELDTLVAEVDAFLDPRQHQFCHLLADLAGISLDSYSANQHLVKQLNYMRSVLKLRFCLEDDPEETRVTLKAVTAPRSRTGGFQVVTSSGKRTTLYSGTTFPSLRALPS